MRVRVPATLGKRLDRLAGVAIAAQFSIPGAVIRYGTAELDARNERLFEELAALPPPKRGGYMLVPAILPSDEWEAQALDAQERLVRETSDWLDAPVANTDSPEPSRRTEA